jgi:hypothetical protein
MKEVRCNGDDCTNVVLKMRPVDFGLAIVFCVACARKRIREGLLDELGKIGFTGGVEVHASREDA